MPVFYVSELRPAITDICNSAVCYDSMDLLRFCQFTIVDLHAVIGYILTTILVSLMLTQGLIVFMENLCRC